MRKLAIIIIFLSFIINSYSQTTKKEIKKIVKTIDLNKEEFDTDKKYDDFGDEIYYTYDNYFKVIKIKVFHSTDDGYNAEYYYYFENALIYFYSENIYSEYNEKNKSLEQKKEEFCYFHTFKMLYYINSENDEVLINSAEFLQKEEEVLDASKNLLDKYLE
jgi:hypothetical protein